MKIKNAKLPELRNLTNKEMDFFLYLVRRQDLRGYVYGVHNQAVCKATGMGEGEKVFLVVGGAVDGDHVVEIEFFGRAEGGAGSLETASCS